MAFVDISNCSMVWPSHPSLGSTTELDLSTIGDKMASIGRIPKTGTIEEIWYVSGSTSGTQTHDITIETLSGQDPSGTSEAISTAFTQTANDVCIATLDSSLAVTLGDRRAVVWEANTSGISRVNGYSSPLSEYASYNRRNTTGSWSQGFRGPCVSFKYSDGSLVPFGGFGVTPITSALSSYDSPDEYGIYFDSIPFAFKATGLWVTLIENDFDTACELNVYDGSDTLLDQRVWSNAEYSKATTSLEYAYIPFSTELTFNQGDVRRICFKPSTTGSNFRFSYFEYDTAAIRTAIKPNMQLTNRSGTGSWTNTTNRVPAFGFQISAIDDGVSAGESTVIVIED